MTKTKTNCTSMQRTAKRSLQVLAAAGMLIGAGLLQSCEKEILTGQPDWLGNSIYERLSEGITTNDGQHRSFSYTLRLIDDLGYKETLSRTGSKTVFATPDDLYEKWFQEHGLTYDKLTPMQKKQLFNNSMVNNAYLVDLMSNVSGNPPQEGLCLRRETATTIFDSIPVMKVDEMPVNPMLNEEKDAWTTLREEGEDIRICKDATSAPMIHFLPSFMQKNNITAEDLSIISNGESTSTDDSWISGKKVISKEQTCKNGYVYVVDGVIEGAHNMAETLHSLPNTTWWAKALDRFTSPQEVTGATLNTYQNLVGAGSKLYELRYFNSSTNHNYVKGGALEEALNAKEVLRLDPGWNQYAVTTPGQDMHYDAAVMIVPTDSALQVWWEHGGGSDLRNRFESWDQVDHEVLATLLNVNMQESFIGSVPSKFKSVLDNTSQRELGIKTEDIVKCYMCCNGIIYLVKEVYSPDSYSSVIYPAELQANGVYSVIDHALTGNYSKYSSSYDFSPYLSAMDSRFSLIIPYNTTVSEYMGLDNTTKVFRMIDPCTFGLPIQKVMEFYYASGKVQAYQYDAMVAMDGSLTIDYTKPQIVPETIIQNRIYDLIDNNVIIGDITAAQQYYQTKAGGMLKAYKSAGVQHFEGGYQIERNETVIVPDSCIVDKGAEGNGVTYGVGCDDARGDKIMDVPMTATKSVYQILKDDFDEKGPSSKSAIFYELLAGSPLLANKSGSYDCGGSDNKNINIFDSYNYTVYVPTNNAIQALIDSKALPTWDDYNALQDDSESEDERVKAEADSLRTLISNRICDFLRYHIQDKSVAINSTSYNNDAFETGKLNPKNNRFFPLTVSADATDLTVTDYLGNTRKVVKDGGFYNKLAREYWISNKNKYTYSASKTEWAKLESSSYAVIHQIDGVLLYSNDQLKPWNAQAASKKRSRRN